MRPIYGKTGAPITQVSWSEALTRHQGSLTGVAEEFGFSPQRAWELTRIHGLIEVARGLRTAAGQPAGPGRKRKPAVSMALEPPSKRKGRPKKS